MKLGKMEATPYDLQSLQSLLRDHSLSLVTPSSAPITLPLADSAFPCQIKSPEALPPTGHGLSPTVSHIIRSIARGFFRLITLPKLL